MTDPNNYRGISLINCIGKVFSSTISTRIKHYLDLKNRTGSEQVLEKDTAACTTPSP